MSITRDTNPFELRQIELRPNTWDFLVTAQSY
jgi:hypothetical protein